MTAPLSRSIAIIVVNYGTPDLAITAVDSVLARDHGSRKIEVHLVDNASPGEDAATFRAAHEDRGWRTRVTLHLERENHGFGRGNNVVLEQLAARPQPPEYVFLLNPDAQLENEVLDILVDRLERDPGAGVAGAGIALPNGQPVTAAFRFPNPAAEFSAALNFGPVARMMARHTVPLSPDHPEGSVGWVAGAAVMMRFAMLQEIGFFDPAYFLYYEEVDLMLQAERAGWRILYVPEARVIHAEGAATDQKSGRTERRRRPAYWYDSWRHYYHKNHGRAGAIRAGLAWTAGAALNHVLAPMRGQSARAPKKFFGDFWGHVMWPLLTGRSGGTGA